MRYIAPCSSLTFFQNAVLIGDGRNALLSAAEHNQHDALNLLIRSGADTTVRDKSGRDYNDLLALPWPNDDDESTVEPDFVDDESTEEREFVS